jgi:hypothetical protein
MDSNDQSCSIKSVLEIKSQNYSLVRCAINKFFGNHQFGIFVNHFFVNQHFDIILLR